MGILFDSVENPSLIKQMMRKNYLEKLEKLGITESRDGISIYSLDNKALNRELTLAHFRKTNIDHDSNKWF
ncbi:hypothetical protein [Cytobacillus firmus]|uniref:hypothetical protein n=1 Tax=Cytobacillus firmus TaxID=1399 RepID=UPI0018CD39E6|nr:hypothetical protein [Cytobacillus firmus]MBG9549749.1 hypothetical protein [Cytobacillus firmus]MBG9603129.1 hypothetical protein [Cytobacillus firmus]MBG9653710.1 hypothetical protein [Cytobacillus firmus]MED1904975.1 hypothetical protein [Cytobacillus firmus]MED1942073.1 hypothetical protein [Cytobacillus firmus]